MTASVHSRIIKYSIAMCNCNNRSTMDVTTPRNMYLTAFFKRSFAYNTVKDRLPAIINDTIDTMINSKEEVVKECGEMAIEKLKFVVAELYNLRTEMQANKALRNILTDAPDAKVFNDCIAKQACEEGRATYFHTVWLLTESYMYRRIWEAFETASLTKIDPFRSKKEELFHSSVESMNKLAIRLEMLVHSGIPANKEQFSDLLKMNLWGNRCDLSITTGVVEKEGETLQDIDRLNMFILCDHSGQIFKALADRNTESTTVDIVLDNAGYELFTDLCVAEYLISKGLAAKIRFHVKSIPYYVSDTRTQDFHWLILQLMKSHDMLSKFATQWMKYLREDIWTIEESDFWILPVDYTQMATLDPKLYRKLGEAKLVIFKGDVNYRKLFGEKNWNHTTPVEDALQGFHPTKLCSLRTIKSEIVVGLKAGVSENIEKDNPKWMETGQYGVIHFCDKIVPLE